MRSLEDIAARLDELSLEYDWPELVTLSEEIGTAMEDHERRIQRLESDLRDREEQFHRMQDPRERERMEYELRARAARDAQRGYLYPTVNDPRAISRIFTP